MKTNNNIRKLNLVPLVLAILFGLALSPSGAQTVYYDFNTPGELINNFTNSLNPGPFKESTSGGVGNSGCLLEVTNDNGGPSTFTCYATYKNYTYDFSTNGAALTVSAMIKIAQANATTGSARFELGFSSSNSIGLDLKSPTNNAELLLAPSSTASPSYNFTPYANNSGSGGISVTLVTNHWYQMNAYFLNVNAGNTFTWWGNLIDYGTNGTTPGAIVAAVTRNTTTYSGLSTDNTVWACMGGSVTTNKTTGVVAVDNFYAANSINTNAPVISTGPTNLTGIPGQTIQLVGAATGVPPLSYQWLVGAAGSGVCGTALMDGGNVSGSISNILTITNASALNGLDYELVVANSYGSTTSSVVTVTVGSATVAPSIISGGQPVGASLYVTQNAQFSVTASGTAPLSYQWYSGVANSGICTNSLTDGGTISGSATNILNISNLALNNAADFRVIISNSAGSVTSLVVTLTVLPGQPIITANPTNLNLYPSQTAQFGVTVSNPTGAQLYYQWLAGVTNSGIYNNLTDGGQISGSVTGALTISNVANGNIGDYIVVVTNIYGAVTSSVGTLIVLPTLAAQNITLAVVEASGLDWNTANEWSDNLPAATSALSKPGSTYEVLTSGMLRTPTNDVITFPGSQLTVDGTGIFWENPNGGAPTTTGQLMTKQLSLHPNYTFQKLVMNGGQIDNGATGLVILSGEMDVVGNTAFYADAAEDSRSIEIGSWLTGTATVSYYAFGTNAPPAATNTIDLNLTGTTNTFSGTWNIVAGTVLGSGLNSLGTNNIVVGPAGELETAYPINNVNSTLFLNGIMLLYQDDTFNSVVVNGVALTSNIYSTADLAAAYPTNFPSYWTQKTGSQYDNNAYIGGSITVLTTAPTVAISTPPTSQAVLAGNTATFSVTATGVIADYEWQVSTNSGATWSDTGGTGGSYTTPVTTTSYNGYQYRVVVNGAGSITSSVATLSVSKPVLSVQKLGSNLQFIWAGQALLLQATNLVGPWTTNSTATSGYTVTPTNPAAYFRLLVN